MKVWLTAVRIFVVMTIITGIIYPLLVTCIAKALWPAKAGGSLVLQDGTVKGSALIAQKFESDLYFHPRPSAVNYNASGSGGSQLGPTSAVLKSRVDDCLKSNNSEELCFSSGSGLDPDITPQAAFAQIERVANARYLGALQKEELKKLVVMSIIKRQWGIWGEERINVLLLNRAVDAQFLANSIHHE